MGSHFSENDWRDTMKFFLSMILVIVMICSLSVVCYGASLEDNTPIKNSGVLLNDPTLTKDQIKKIKMKRIVKIQSSHKELLSRYLH